MTLIDYVNLQGPLPDIAGTKTGDLLIMGAAACLWDDLKRYDHLHIGDRMALNDAMTHYPDRLDHGVSLHADMMHGFAFKQFYKGAHNPWPIMQTHAHIPNYAVQHVWPLRRDGGTSGLFAIYISLLMGYERIILAGIPYDGNQHFYEPPWMADSFYTRDDVQKEFMQAIPFFKGKVKSLSGKTKDWLGEPE
jgi:hypothetical protein